MTIENNKSPFPAEPEIVEEVNDGVSDPHVAKLMAFGWTLEEATNSVELEV